MSNIKTPFLQQDRWILDLAVAIVFAAAMAAAFEIAGESGTKHKDRVLSAAILAIVSYLGTFLLGVIFRYFTIYFRSWIWMAVVGALVYTLVRVVTAIPHWLDYFHRFSDSTGQTAMGYLASTFPLVLFFFVIWAFSGTIIIVFVRYICFIAGGQKPLPE